MPSTPHSLIDYIRTVVDTWRDDPRSDAELLSRFAADGDENAFKALVCRHGPMVWRTCRHILGDTPDAEDAYQAALLALARKATRFTIKNPAGWLHRVAVRVALRAKRTRRLDAASLAEIPDKSINLDERDLRDVLDAAIERLPDKLRRTVVLCYLNGHTTEEAARLLICPKGTVLSRLSAARDKLKNDLTRRGISVSIATLTVMSSEVPPRTKGTEGTR